MWSPAGDIWSFSDYPNTHLIIKVIQDHVSIHNLNTHICHFVPQRTFAIFLETFSFVTKEEVLPAYIGWGPRVLLNILQCSRQPPPHKKWWPSPKETCSKKMRRWCDLIFYPKSSLPLFKFFLFISITAFKFDLEFLKKGEKQVEQRLRNLHVEGWKILKFLC